MPIGLAALALGSVMQVGQPAPFETPNAPPLANSNNQYGFEGRFEQRYPYDSQQNWVHGYFQEIPAYGGHVFYRPYNYKDVLSQSQTAAGWGLSPTMPYSQQFWHRYHDQATMLKLSHNGTGELTPATMAGPVIVTPAPPVWQPNQTVSPFWSAPMMAAPQNVQPVNYPYLPQR